MQTLGFMSAKVAKSLRTNWWPSARIEAGERTVKELEEGLSHATRSVLADQERSTAAGPEEFRVFGRGLLQ